MIQLVVALVVDDDSDNDVSMCIESAGQVQDKFESEDDGDIVHDSEDDGDIVHESEYDGDIVHDSEEGKLEGQIGGEHS